MLFSKAHETVLYYETQAEYCGIGGVNAYLTAYGNEQDNDLYDEALAVIKAAQPAEVNGVQIINVTPHPISFDVDGEVVSVPTSGVIINAKALERSVSKYHNYELVTTVFVEDPQSEMDLSALEYRYPNALIVGSIIAAQAYPGARVVAMVPAPGYERVAPAEKRMRTDKFNVYMG